MNTVKKVLKVLSLMFLSIIFVGISAVCVFMLGGFNNFASTSLDASKLSFPHEKVLVLDSNGSPLDTALSGKKNIQLTDVPRHTVDAFISIEDKNFYTHNGINVKRLLKATFDNIRSKKIVSGASTISQQLIKNTHLTSSKTLRRKIDEVILTRDLEKNYTKDEILQNYLNAICFGSGAFGLDSASNKFFSKDVKDLSIKESATLAGIIKSPRLYSPISNPVSCLKRRNLVLRELAKDGKISLETCGKLSLEPLGLKLNNRYLNENTYYNEVVLEAQKILHKSEKDLMLENLTITTYLDPDLEQVLLDTLDENVGDKYDSVCLILDNKTGGILGYYGKSDFQTINLKRSPGSTFKPIISYAPALEYNLLSPCSLVLDEKINMDGYKPKNYKGAYHGWVSAEDALAHSYNIPSVKILDFVKIDRAKNFASKLGVDFASSDNGYALALGGMTEGLSPLKLANCYQAFANNGAQIPARFIKEIRTKDGKILYQNAEQKTQVMKPSTAYLTTSMLKKGVTNGTSRKLNNCGILCAKTGTVGLKNSNENSDAWSVSYNKFVTACVWVGGKHGKNLPNNVTGSNLPTEIASTIYKKSKLETKEDFERPDDVVEKEISTLDYNNYKVKLATNSTPDRYKMPALFSVDNLPDESNATENGIENFEISVKKVPAGAHIEFLAKSHLRYKVYKVVEDEVTVLGEFLDKQGVVFVDDFNLKKGTFATYYVEANNSMQVKKSNAVKFYFS